MAADPISAPRGRAQVAGLAPSARALRCRLRRWPRQRQMRAWPEMRRGYLRRSDRASRVASPECPLPGPERLLRVHRARRFRLRLLPLRHEPQPRRQGARLVQAADAHPKIKPFRSIAEVCSTAGGDPGRRPEDGLAELSSARVESFDFHFDRQLGEQRLVLTGHPRLGRYGPAARSPGGSLRARRSRAGDARSARRRHTMRARSSLSQTPSRSEISMPWTVASDDSAPSMRPKRTRVAGVDSAREIKLASTPFSSSAARPADDHDSRPAARGAKADDRKCVVEGPSEGLSDADIESNDVIAAPWV